MTKAFPSIARRLKNTGIKLLKMGTSLITRFIENWKRYFLGDTVDVDVDVRPSSSLDVRPSLMGASPEFGWRWPRCR
nr:hypothetical protein [Nostoc commune]